MNYQNADEHRTDDHDSRLRHRPLLILLFAVILASIASWTSADEPHIRYGASNAVTVTRQEAVIRSPRQSGGAIAQPTARPQYVELNVGLANFDADAEPDGWRAEVVLRDEQDRPVKMRAQAKFELMPLVETISEHRFASAYSTPIRWTTDLEFDDQGIARVRLPLRSQLRPVLGWGESGDWAADSRSRQERSQRRQYRFHKRSRSFVTIDVRETIGNPNLGEMRVRVSVPTEGVFRATAPVAIRPSVLVDTKWPYR